MQRGKSPVKWTHKRLVKEAARWLQARGCVVVCTEVVTQALEAPDALGWQGNGETWLVECKASRADFHRDAEKPFRVKSEMGMGNKRFYMAPKGLLKHEEMPPGWGLVPVEEPWYGLHGQCHNLVNREAEARVLVSLLRRVGQRAVSGVSIKAYTYSTKDTATLGVLEDD